MEQPEAALLVAGTAAGRGIADGPARVLGGPDDFSRLRPGDVLVCRTTDPAWTPLLVRAAAVVTEVGGMLCHAAIVAREAGIPAVVGATGARTALSDGQRVRVDGATGRVTTVGATDGARVGARAVGAARRPPARVRRRPPGRPTLGSR